MTEALLNSSMGLTNLKLSQATAIENDVVSGKTFYSGNRILKTGTFTGLTLRRDNIKSISGSHTVGRDYSITISIPFSQFKLIYLDITIFNYSASEMSKGTCTLLVGSETLVNTEYTRPGGPTKQEWKMNMDNLQDKWRSGDIKCTISGNWDNDGLTISGFCVGRI